ncbi:MAG TPA: YlmC/YmxH family sporulation protein [Candidatus Avoscillospira stercorigallinarum]|uniref:YlmC/YmxH family sporulation protein n=1 Tax=Candidatus Avoscillospira stercorigallinarum TaxID=2840708 RepID=A0A9D1CPB5_9FIRM|nr:YlmC/YmxH family sporulation protein [Candidatus Avoscillospira stercorigallinarum]
MYDRFSALSCKEVINVTDGCRLGYTADLELDTSCGRVVALIVPKPGKCFGLLPSQEVYVIPWACIRRIGADLILVDVQPQDICRPREKRKLL